MCTDILNNLVTWTNHVNKYRGQIPLQKYYQLRENVNKHNLNQSNYTCVVSLL